MCACALMLHTQNPPSWTFLSAEVIGELDSILAVQASLHLLRFSHFSGTQYEISEPYFKNIG